jgi:hypothetical protein
VSGQVPPFAHKPGLPAVLRPLPPTGGGDGGAACALSLHCFLITPAAAAPQPAAPPPEPFLLEFGHLVAAARLPDLPAFDVWLADGTPARAQLLPLGQLPLSGAQLRLLRAFHGHCSAAFTGGLGKGGGGPKCASSGIDGSQFFAAREAQQPSLAALQQALQRLGQQGSGGAADAPGLPGAWHHLLPLNAAFRQQAAAAAAAGQLGACGPASQLASLAFDQLVNLKLVADVAAGSRLLQQQPGLGTSCSATGAPPGRILLSFHAGRMDVYHTPASGSSGRGSGTSAPTTVDSPLPAPQQGEVVTFREYYQRKHGLEGLLAGLAMLEVRPGRGLGGSGTLLRPLSQQRGAKRQQPDTGPAVEGGASQRCRLGEGGVQEGAQQEGGQQPMDIDRSSGGGGGAAGLAAGAGNGDGSAHELQLKLVLQEEEEEEEDPWQGAAQAPGGAAGSQQQQQQQQQPSGSGAALAAAAAGAASTAVHLPADLPGLLLHPLPVASWQALQQAWQLTYRLEGLLVAQELLQRLHPPR